MNNQSPFITIIILIIIIIFNTINHIHANNNINNNDQIINAMNMKWGKVPGGEFYIGTNKPEIPLDDESPERKATVEPFEMMIYEASNENYWAFANATGYVSDSEQFKWSFVFENMLPARIKDEITQSAAAAPWWLPVPDATWRAPEGEGSNILKRLNHPVVHVSWNDAQEFCKFIGGRLPTEIEWERAARGGKRGRMYPWGNKLMPRGKHRCNIWHGDFPKKNTEDDGYMWSAPIDAFGPQNKYGFYNIVGNVWEWVEDDWIPNHGKKQQGMTYDKCKKGGSYMCHKSYCFRYRVAARSHNSADSAASNLGFRCARDL